MKKVNYRSFILSIICSFVCTSLCFCLTDQTFTLTFIFAVMLLLSPLHIFSLGRVFQGCFPIDLTSGSLLVW